MLGLGLRQRSNHYSKRFYFDAFKVRCQTIIRFSGGDGGGGKRSKPKSKKAKGGGSKAESAV